MTFNVMFKMVVRPGKDDLGGVKETTTMGTNVRFVFGEAMFFAMSEDVKLAYTLDQVGRFEAWAI